MKKRIIVVATLLLTSSLFGGQAPEFEQEPTAGEKKLVKIEPAGFVFLTAYTDTRQVFGAYDVLDAELPLKKRPDPVGKDINGRGQTNLISVETLLQATIKSPSLLGDVAKAFVEGNFAGSTGLGSQLGQFELYQAFFELKSCNGVFIAGQTYHPMYVLDCFPNVISYNGGNPIEFLARVAQIQFRYRCNDVEFLGAVLSQIFPFVSLGPSGTTNPLIIQIFPFVGLGEIKASSEFARNAQVPNLHAQVRYYYGKKGNHVAGAAIDYKRLAPRLVTNKGFKAHEFLSSIAAIAYTSLDFDWLKVRLKILYGGNTSNFGIFGGSGYAVHSFNPVTDERTYTNLRNIGFWIDLEGKKEFEAPLTKKVEPGIFIGFTHNLGAPKTIIQNILNADGFLENTIYDLVPDAASTFRVSPRLRVHLHPIIFGTEIEYTRTAYGTLTDTGKVTNAHPIAYTRFLLTMYYAF